MNFGSAWCMRPNPTKSDRSTVIGTQKLRNGGDQTKSNPVKPSQTSGLEMGIAITLPSPQQRCRLGRAGSAGRVGWNGQSDQVKPGQTCREVCS